LGIDTSHWIEEDGAVFNNFSSSTMKKHVFASISLALTLALGLPHSAYAHRNGQGAASELSAISALPVVVSVAAPALLLSGGAVLTVVTVSAVAEGTVWVLERASDGARASLTVSGQVVVGTSMVAGAAVLVTASAAGWVLSVAGQAIAFIPNEVGKALLYNEQVTR
jgi:hypothetical protein